MLIDKFSKAITNWNWNNDLQGKYYDFMKENGFLTGLAKRKEKDAREKTSGLVDLGLLTSNRKITEVGNELIEITKSLTFESNNIFNINSDSYIYLKQLIKMSIEINGHTVRPFIVTLKCLNELNYLTYDEFTYFIPLIHDEKSMNEIIGNIKLYRKNEISIVDIIYRRLMDMGNYRIAKEKFIENTVNENLICLIGMNRKSKTYDKPYYVLYKDIKNHFLNNVIDIKLLYNSVNGVKQNILWKNLIFVKKNIINSNCPFIKCKNEKELKEVFFKYLHVFKAMATLSDYFDLNRRYFNITDIIIFEEQTVKLDLLPKYYFNEIDNELYKEAFKVNDNIKENINLDKISKAFNLDISKIYEKISGDLGIKIQNFEQLKFYLNDEKYRRFNHLIDKKFTDDVLIELLNCFENRDDKRIEELVTNEALIPTIFEYILGIIWYKISEKKGDILKFMKLSLEANLMPKTHAAGGNPDIFYEYEASIDYPKHSLLIEATLSDKNNQRRMEMEPVSRHLGDYRIRYNNPYDYSLFISTYLDKNVISDFRYRKNMPYFKNEKRIDGMKIISLDTASLKKIIKKGIKYKRLYKLFDEFFDMPLDTPEWYENMIKELTVDFN